MYGLGLEMILFAFISLLENERVCLFCGLFCLVFGMSSVQDSGTVVKLMKAKKEELVYWEDVGDFDPALVLDILNHIYLHVYLMPAVTDKGLNKRCLNKKKLCCAPVILIVWGKVLRIGVLNQSFSHLAIPIKSVLFNVIIFLVLAQANSDVDIVNNQ